MGTWGSCAGSTSEIGLVSLGARGTRGGGSRGRHSGEEGITTALRRFKEKLDTEFATEFRITELAEQTGFSPVYLRRTFADRYGCSPKQYLDQLRNEHAVRRLRYTGDSVTDIARACGYSDVYQFSKTFKKRNGFSPTEYRRMQGE